MEDLSERSDYDIINEVPRITSVTINPIDVTTFSNETPSNGTNMNYYFYQVSEDYKGVLKILFGVLDQT